MKTHWKKFCNPDYLGAYSLDENEIKVLTIKEVKQEVVTGSNGKKEECSVCYWQENEKPMILNRTNCKAIEKLYKTPYIEDWAGRKVAIKAEPVNAFGDIVEALRIQKTIPKLQKFDTKCADCGMEIKDFNNMSAKKLAEYTHKKYGKCLCSDCAKIEAEKLLENDQIAQTQNELDNL